MVYRYVCTAIEEMRMCVKTGNYSYLPGLIEEAQSLCNRMESSLWEQKEHTDLHKEIKKLRKERDKLKEEKDAT